MRQRFSIKGAGVIAAAALLLAGCTGQVNPEGTVASTLMEQTTILSSTASGQAQTNAAKPTPAPLQPQLSELIALTGGSDDQLVAALGPGEEIKSENAEKISGRAYQVGLFGGTHELVATLNELGLVEELAVTLVDGSDYEAIQRAINEAAGHEPDQRTEDSKQRSCSWIVQQCQIDLVEAGGTAVLTMATIQA